MDVDRELDAPRPAARASVVRWWALSMVVVTLPFTQLLTGAATAVHSDAQEYHLPLWRWIWHRIADGTSPFWGGYDFAGQNVAGIGQGAIFYPPNAIFAWSDTVAAFRWWSMAHVWLAASGAFMWSWHRWRSTAGATVSAVVYALNGVFVLHFVHMNFTIAMAWLPFVLLGLDLVIERWSPLRTVAFAVPLGMVALAGQPQMLWAALVAVGTVSLVELTVRGTDIRAVGRVAASGALGLGLAAVQLLPQYLFSRTSDRPSLTGDVALRSSATTTDLLTALFPWYKGGANGLPLVSSDWTGGNTYHEVGNHLGLAACVLAGIAVIARRRDRRVLSLSLVGLLGLVMAMAWSTPVAPLIFRVVPFADRFRGWPRYLLLLNLAIACLAGLGLRVALDAPRVWRRRLLIGGTCAALFATVIRVLTDVGGQLASGWTMTLTIVLPLASLVVVVAALGMNDRRSAQLLITLAVATPSVLFALGSPWRSEGLSPAEASAFFDASQSPLPVFDAPGGVDRWIESGTQLRGVQTVTSTARVNGYDPLIQQDFATVTGATYLGLFIDSRVWSPPGLFADVLRITTFAAPEQASPSPGWTFVAASDGHVATWQRTPRLPEAYVVGGVAADTLDGIIDRLQDDATDLTGTVYLDDRGAASGAFAGRTVTGPAGTVSGALGDDGDADFTVTADRAGALVVSTAWLDGWTATVDGRDVPVARANGLVLAVPVPEGTSTVHLEFHAPGLRVAAIVSLLSLLVLLGWLVLPPLRRRLSGG